MAFTGPRQVRLTRCLLTSAMRKDAYDLTAQIQSIDIYESIFQNTIVASLTLYEGDALQELLPIIGTEIVRIEFEVDRPESNDVYRFKQSFRIHRLVNQSFVKNDERQYTLDLVTAEFYNSVRERMTRRYASQTASSAVQNVLTQYLNISPEKLRKSKFEETADTVDAFIPNYTPLQAINYLTLLSRTVVKNESNFVFYETLDGFYFKSISKIIADGKQNADTAPVFTINADVLTGAKTVDLKTAYNSIIQLHQDESFDVLRDITAGTLHTRTLQLDFFGRVFNTDDFRYTTEFPKLTHLDEHPCYPDNFDQIVNKNVKQFIVPCNIAASQSNFITKKSPIEFDPLVEGLPLRNFQLKSLQRNRTRLSVPGQPQIRAGNVIKLIYPSSRVLQQGTDSATEDVNKNLPRRPTPYHSGLHLITHVRHEMTRKSQGVMEYIAHIEVVRDAFGTPLPKFKEQT